MYNGCELDIFKATVEHRSHERILFYLSLTPDLEKQFIDRVGMEEGESIYERFSMYAPVGISLI